MTRHPRHCHDCGSSSGETAFPPRKPRGKPLRCCECMTEAARDPVHLDRATAVQTRASYRAAYRHRLASAQGDLVDLLRPPA
jgi:hypothetical protein